MSDPKNPAGANWQLAHVHVSKVLEALKPAVEAAYDPAKIVPFPPRPVPRGDTPAERMLSVAGPHIRRGR